MPRLNKETLRARKSFDRRRRRKYGTPAPTIYLLETVKVGRTPAAPKTGGDEVVRLALTSDDYSWFGGVTRNFTLRREFLEFEVIEFDGIEDHLNNTSYIGFQGQKHKFEPPIKPDGKRRVWIVRASASGESWTPPPAP